MSPVGRQCRFLDKRRVGGLVTLKYAPYSRQYSRKTRGDLGGSTDQKVSEIFEKLYFVKSSTKSLHNKEKWESPWPWLQWYRTAVKINSIKLLIDNSGNLPHNGIKLIEHERLVIICQIKLHLITLKVKIMRIIQKEHTQHFSTVLPPFCLLAVKITPITLCGPTCAHRLAQGCAKVSLGRIVLINLALQNNKT